MKNSDEAIDRVLEGLQQAAPPEGMTQRIHQAMQYHASPKRGLSILHLARRSHLLSPRILLATATLILVVATICWRTTQSSRVERNSTRAQQQKPASQSTQPPRSPVTTAQSAHAVPVGPKPHLAALLTSAKSKHNRIQVASYPAPEAPLTDEERLLLRLAHGADPQTLEAYSPSQSAAHLAQQKADFQQFFDPPATVNNE